MEALVSEGRVGGGMGEEMGVTALSTSTLTQHTALEHLTGNTAW